MNKAKRIILASTSIFRQKLLKDAGISFESMASIADEKEISGLPPRELARARSRFKGFDVALRCAPSSLVIGADQVLGLESVSFDKAHSAEEARERLQMFSGKTHVLHSGFCLILVDSDGKPQLAHEEVVDVPMTMRHLSPQEIRDYVETGEWHGSVGCYRIEGEGQKLFVAPSTDMSAIIGLPLEALLPVLKKFLPET